MNSSLIFSQLTQLKTYLSKEWLLKYHNILHEEHLNKLAIQLSHFKIEGAKKLLPPPKFDEEITPSIHDSFVVFQPWLNAINSSESLDKLAFLFEQIPFSNILLILGQRLTSASIQNDQAIPPSYDILLKSCMQPFNNQIKVATRAWEKHIGRSTDTYWGKIYGNSKEKEKMVFNLITKMLKNYTWWNVFYHYKHELVFEIRVTSGHGIRWNHTGTIFIGFLEPF